MLQGSDSALAQELHVFRNGEVADAEKINENFSALMNAGGPRVTPPHIEIITSPVASAGSHPVLIRYTDPDGLFMVSENLGGGGQQVRETHLFDRPESYEVQRDIAGPFGASRDIYASAIDMHGVPQVALVTISSDTLIQMGRYDVVPEFNVPSRDDVPGSCFIGSSISRLEIGGAFLDGADRCPGTPDPFSFYLDAPVAMPDASGAVACVGDSFSPEAVLWNMHDLVAYGLQRPGYGGGSSGHYEIWREITYQFTPPPNAAVDVTLTEYCQYQASVGQSTVGYVKGPFQFRGVHVPD